MAGGKIEKTKNNKFRRKCRQNKLALSIERYVYIHSHCVGSCMLCMQVCVNSSKFRPKCRQNKLAPSIERYTYIHSHRIGSCILYMHVCVKSSESSTWSESSKWSKS